MRLLYNQLCGCVIELFVKPLWFRFNRLRQLSHFRHEINIYIFFWVTILEQILRKESWKKKAQSPNRASPLRTLKAQKNSPDLGKTCLHSPFPSSFTYLIILISLTSSLIQLSRTCRNRLFTDFASIQYQPIGIREFLSELSSFVWINSKVWLGCLNFLGFFNFVSISLIGYLIALSFCVNFQLY